MNKEDITKIKVPIDDLKDIYQSRAEIIANENDIGDQDITPLFWSGLRQKLIKGEQLKLVFKGQTTKGKSTACIYVQYVLNQMIQELVEEKKIK
jgi:hypothetical protein